MRRLANRTTIFVGLLMLSGIAVVVRLDYHLMQAIEMAQHSATKVREEGFHSATSDLKFHLVEYVNRTVASHNVTAAKLRNAGVKMQRLTDDIVTRMTTLLRDESEMLLGKPQADFAPSAPSQSDLHVCVVVRASVRNVYTRELETLLFSLLSQDYSHFDVFVLDTSRTALAESEQQSRSELQLVLDKMLDERLHLSPVTSEAKDDDWGLAQADREIARLVTLAANRTSWEEETDGNRTISTVDPRSPCAYFVVVNAGGLYVRWFLTRVSEHWKGQKPSAIVTDFVSTKAEKTLCTPPVEDDPRSDLGAMVLHRRLFGTPEAPRTHVLTKALKASGSGAATALGFRVADLVGATDPPSVVLLRQTLFVRQ